jgi:hypothetical protein
MGGWNCCMGREMEGRVNWWVRGAKWKEGTQKCYEASLPKIRKRVLR